MKTFVGLIPDAEQVAHAGEALKVAGIGESEFSMFMRPAEVWQRLGGHGKLPIVYRFAFYGALLGLGVGLLYGVPAGIMNCSVMGCSLSTSFVFLVIISIFWLLGGAFLGAIVGVDQLERDLYSYVEGVRQGGVLLVVQTRDEQVPDVARILKQEHGLLVHSIEER